MLLSRGYLLQPQPQHGVKSPIIGIQYMEPKSPELSCVIIDPLPHTSLTQFTALPGLSIPLKLN